MTEKTQFKNGLLSSRKRQMLEMTISPQTIPAHDTSGGTSPATTGHTETVPNGHPTPHTVRKKSLHPKSLGPPRDTVNR